MTRHLVLWDGECGMCRRFADAITVEDTAGQLQMLAYQDCPSPPMTPALHDACERSLHVITTDGRTLLGVDAVLFVYQTVGWRVAGWARARPVRWTLEPFYRLLAANRRWFSKVLYTGDAGLSATCKVEPPEPIEDPAVSQV